MTGATSFPLLWKRRPGPGVSWLRIAAFLFAGLIALPILVILASLALPLGEEWEHVRRYVLAPMVVNSFVLALGTGAGVLVVGVATAWLVTMCAFPGRRIFEWALILPLAAPAYVLAYVYTDFLQHAGPVQTGLRNFMGWGPRAYWFPEIRSLEGAILIFTAVFYPYVYLLARSAFLQQSANMMEASRSLGCTPWASFRRVALPLARPAIAAGVALALMETLADFGAASHFGLLTFTTGIYRVWYDMGDKMLAAQLSSALLGTVLLLLLIERLNRGRARYHDTRAQVRHGAPYRLSFLAGLGAILACAVPLFIGFVLPAILLIYMHVTAGHDMFSTRYLTFTFNSVTLSGLAALLAVFIALVIAYSARLWPGRLTRSVMQIAGMGYALPGTVVAVGVFLPLAAFDNALDSFTRGTMNFSTGLLFTGGIGAILYAYQVRFMSISLGSVDAALARITPNMEAAARSLGAGPGATLRRVHAPLLSGGLLTAALIVFVEVMKELPATLILRPFNFDTLAIQAYRLAQDERLAQAATPSLMIVAVGLIPVIILSRAISNSREIPLVP